MPWLAKCRTAAILQPEVSLKWEQQTRVTVTSVYTQYTFGCHVRDFFTTAEGHHIVDSQAYGYNSHETKATELLHFRGEFRQSLATQWYQLLEDKVMQHGFTYQASLYAART
jgi:hypothetical protein